MRAVRRSWMVALCIGGLSACGPRGGTTTGSEGPEVDWGLDDSTECPEGADAANVLLADGAGPDLESRAAVQQLRPAADQEGIGPDRYATVVLAGDGPEAARSFLVAVPPGTTLPFAEGDVLAVRVHAETIGSHQVVHATIADAAGRLLLGLSGDGDTAWAPGWRLRELEVATTQPAPNAGGAERREHWVGLSTGGRVARVPPHQCRQLEVDGAVWRVTAHTIRYGEGTRLPDSSEYTQYSLLRADRP